MSGKVSIGDLRKHCPLTRQHCTPLHNDVIVTPVSRLLQNPPGSRSKAMCDESKVRLLTQVDDLAKTIEAVPADAVVVATPMDLNRLIHMSKPSTTVA